MISFGIARPSDAARLCDNGRFCTTPPCLALGGVTRCDKYPAPAAFAAGRCADTTGCPPRTGQHVKKWCIRVGPLTLLSPT